MQNDDKVREIREMKETLQRHYVRFRELRDAGRTQEALEQFNVTLQAASDLMEASTRVLKGLAMPQPPEGEQGTGGGKIYHFPKVHRTH